MAPQIVVHFMLTELPSLVLARESEVLSLRIIAGELLVSFFFSPIVKVRLLKIRLVLQAQRGVVGHVKPAGKQLSQSSFVPVELQATGSPAVPP